METNATGFKSARRFCGNVLPMLRDGGRSEIFSQDYLVFHLKCVLGEREGEKCGAFARFVTLI